jgi:ATP-dependent DNA helicase RecG
MEIGRALQPLKAPILKVRGVGPRIAELLAKKDINTVEDLIYFCPIRYEDRRLVKSIGLLTEGERASVVGRVVSSRESLSRNRRKRIRTAVLEDATGRIVLTWFRFARQYMSALCKKGNLLFATGQVGRFGGTLQMVHPDAFLLDDEEETESRQAILPIYSELEGIKQGTVRRIMREALADCGGLIESNIPSEIERAQKLPTLRAAFSNLHNPDGAAFDESSQRTFHRRLILEEFFLFQTALLLKGKELKQERGIAFASGGALHAALMTSLPFALTGGQRRALDEIIGDMEKGEPMNRLLQGDVGCGKTIVAIAAACVALDFGYQVAFLAPTEILAEQQYLTVHRTFETLGVRPILLRGGIGQKERKTLIEEIREGTARVVVGTHALLQEDVAFMNLGLAIIDEQHRFGVLQRKALKEKGLNPDMLVMTATPIPRTLAMVVFGDLDVSIIEGMPAGRQPIVTRVFPDARREKVYELVRQELRAGRQAFLVYPLIDESDKMELRDATGMAAHLHEKVFPEYRIRLLHGRMGTEEKEEIMLAFRRGDIDVLVSTTVIEVGIDIPNATVIVVEHAERFGLSQLHQLRGRIGRGSHPSKCLLVASEKQTANAVRRLKKMEETQDGFLIAEEDMSIRGPGDMLGVRQAGLPRFRIGDIVRNGDIMSQARSIAATWLRTAPVEAVARVRAESISRWGENLDFYEVL